MTTPGMVPLATYTVATAMTNLTFSNIPSGFGDLVIIATDITTGGLFIRLNNDTGSNYQGTRWSQSDTTLYAGNYSGTSFQGNFYPNPGIGFILEMEIFDYSATNKQKAVLSRHMGASGRNHDFYTHRWTSTAAVNQVNFISTSGNFVIGAKFNLFGVVK